MVKLAQTTIRSTELSIAYSPCYKLAAFDGFQFIAKVFRQLAYNGLQLYLVADLEAQIIKLAIT